LTRKAFTPLINSALDEEYVALTESILQEYQDDIVEYHKLRTRKAGRDSHIDLHLVLNPDKSIQEAHDLCDEIESKIYEKIPHSQVLIHVEPSRGEIVRQN
jgi:divalent metal cation (Fe/Co/Zn/Cd) transporter